ncbi:hypothetical protein Hanom_Chr10g00879531 [Helianthus anomalus]
MEKDKAFKELNAKAQERALGGTCLKRVARMSPAMAEEDDGEYVFGRWVIVEWDVFLSVTQLDMLQEEHDIVIDKLCRVEEKREESEARARELEKQVYTQRYSHCCESWVFNNFDYTHNLLGLFQLMIFSSFVGGFENSG